MELRKALLIVDRGSREPEVFGELDDICKAVKNKGGYSYSTYCFLEVLPPFISEGIARCVASGADFITLVPFFLYPGMKLKDAVKKSAELMHRQKLSMAITKPLSYHPLVESLVHSRIREAKKANGITLPDSECDILVIGHGSSDGSARDAFAHVSNAIRPRYRRLYHCSLELDTPTIAEGIHQAVAGKPHVLIMMPYFLHKGAHVKRDIIAEVSAALQKHNFSNAFMTQHIGTDETVAEIIVERAREAEARRLVI